MAAVRQNGRKHDEDLDKEYLQILRKIKPYITCIMNNHYIELIRVWLEKLSDLNLHDKALRNTYLVKLGKQIEIGIFEEPFIDPPPDGPLPSFKDTWKEHKPEKGESNISLKQVWPQITNETSAQTVDTSNGTSQNEISFSTANNSSRNFHEKAVKHIKEPDNEASAKRFSNASREQKHNTHTQRIQVNEMKEKLNYVERCTKELSNNNNFQGASTVERINNIPILNQTYVPQNYYEFPQKEMHVYTNANKQKQKRLKHKKSESKPFVSDDSSWCDVTEVSTNATVYGSGDAEGAAAIYETSGIIELREMYETKITNLVAVIEDLKRENVSLNKHMDNYEKDLSLRNTKAETSLHNLASEVECLKSRLQELLDIKMSLQTSHFAVTTEWQNTISSLHNKLDILQRKNNELKLENNELERKLNEFDSERRKEIMNLKRKLSDLHAKETDMLKHIHAREITDIESKYNEKLQEQEVELQCKINDLKQEHENILYNKKDNYENLLTSVKSDYDNKIENLNVEYDKNIVEKDAEIEKLEHMLQDQCMRMQEEVHIIRCQIESNVSTSNENYLDKINFLQKCILKMEKLYQKAEKENTKQITKLRRELDYRDKTNQLTLTTQRADFISHSFTGRQNEIDEIVTKLEEHYKKILVEHQRRYMEEKKQDAKIITELKDQLTQYKTEY